jgi:hypothetical protein
MHYSERKACIFCKDPTLIEFFDSDKIFPIGNFVVSDPEYDFVFIPYNVQECANCGAIQTKYAGDLNLIYGDNLANFYGTIRGTMNELFADFVGGGGKGIIEVGAGSGALADIIIAKNTGVPYHIVDPSYGGSRENKIVHASYFEEFDVASAVTASTIVMSHVFEHFYDPVAVISKMAAAPSVQRICISVPDFENYIANGTYHVLNPEHTYYVDNQYIKQLFLIVGFSQARIQHHAGHSVFFEFVRNGAVCGARPSMNRGAEVRAFFSRCVDRIANSKDSVRPAYVWPCSMHTLFCGALGLNVAACSAVLDNSPHKIGKYLYGHGLRCESFAEFLKTCDMPSTLYITGGCYNEEVLAAVAANRNITAHIL